MGGSVRYGQGTFTFNNSMIKVSIVHFSFHTQADILLPVALSPLTSRVLDKEALPTSKHIDTSIHPTHPNRTRYVLHHLTPTNPPHPPVRPTRTFPLSLSSPTSPIRPKFQHDTIAIPGVHYTNFKPKINPRPQPLPLSLSFSLGIAGLLERKWRKFGRRTNPQDSLHRHISPSISPTHCNYRNHFRRSNFFIPAPPR